MRRFPRYFAMRTLLQKKAKVPLLIHIKSRAVFFGVQKEPGTFSADATNADFDFDRENDGSV